MYQRSGRFPGRYLCTLFRVFRLLLIGFRVINTLPEGNRPTENKKNHKEETNMRTNLYLEGKKITRKAAAELVGEDRLKRMIAEAKEGFFRDPLEQQSWFIGRGCLTIEFR